MIGNILSHISEELNRYICSQQNLNADEKKVFLSYVVDQDGSIATTEQNVVLVTLVDLTPDPVAYTQKIQPNRSGGVTESIEFNSLHINLRVLFSAYFMGERAKDALNYLTLILQFFHSKSSFNRTNSPGLPDSVEKLEFNVEPLDYSAQNNMWGILGAKYMPSVVYKVRMITLYDKNTTDFTPPISSITLNDELE